MGTRNYAILSAGINNVLKVGLTGGIGSGKSTVAALFAKYHIPIIEADDIARILTEPNQVAFKKIIAHFNDPKLLKNGTLNRRYLRQLIFNSPKARRWLEQLLHPLICQKIKAMLRALHTPYCIIVIPLLCETGPYTFIDRILVVDTLQKMQVERVAKRDRVTPTHIKKMLRAQCTRKQHIQQANDIIDNTHNKRALHIQVARLHNLYTHL